MDTATAKGTAVLASTSSFLLSARPLLALSTTLCTNVSIARLICTRCRGIKFLALARTHASTKHTTDWVQSWAQRGVVGGPGPRKALDVLFGLLLLPLQRLLLPPRLLLGRPSKAHRCHTKGHIGTGLAG